MIGNKANNLIALRDKYGLFVPDFVVVPFEDITDNTQKQAQPSDINSGTIDRIHDLITKKGWDKVSFRTSASNEDGVKASFAGLYESYVNIKYSKSALKEYILKCYNSTFSERVKNYAKSHNINRLDHGGSVIIQDMFFGKQSGVIFSEDGSGNMQIVYSDSWKNVVVDNRLANELLVSKKDLSRAIIPEHFKTLVKQVSVLEKSLNMPLDIEWSFDGKTIAFLQLRPQTVPNLEYNLTWDSTNISENYPGITLPLTYSFIRSIYAGVYPEFLRLIGLDKQKLSAKSNVFNNMLGYLNGRVYYRITSWYQLVDLIPGKNNQEYFESMLNPVNKKGSGNKKISLDIQSIIAIVRFTIVLLCSPHLSRKFKREFSKKYIELGRAIPDNVNAETIFSNLQEIKKSMIELWAIPVLNDIRVMVFHGILKKILITKYSHREYIGFLQGLSDRASIKPLDDLVQLGEYIKNQMRYHKIEKISELEQTNSWDECLEKTKEYIEKYSARTPGELKLESPTISKSPKNIMILALKSRKSDDHLKLQSEPEKTSVSEHGIILSYVARNTRSAIDWRERFRFNRAQIFRLASEAYLTIGKRLFDESIIDSPEDIFYLYEREIDEIINGHSLDYELKELIALRKNKVKKYEKVQMSLLVTGRGIIATRHLNNESLAKHVKNQGLGVSKGRVSAKVIVAKEFDPNLDVKGKILVVTHIDPGWTLQFTQAEGVITELGNALSHVSIIARELNIPAIVAVRNATNMYSNGDFVTMDGITGEITIAKSKPINQ